MFGLDKLEYLGKNSKTRSGLGSALVKQSFHFLIYKME